MTSFVGHAFQYAGYGAEVCLLVVLLASGTWKKLPYFFLYVVGFVGVDAILRPVFLYHYGWTSFQFRDCYWISDVALTVGAFLLISALFRRAFASNQENWIFMRRTLAIVFGFIVFISCFALSEHFDHIFTRFIVEFQQNLYFACLVLNTLLYVTLQKTEGVDERLDLLVCGLGIEFAGPAANLALMYLTPGGRFAGLLLTIIMPVCNIAMLMTWLYAVRQPAKIRKFAGQKIGQPVSVFAESNARGAH
ncbi:MAG: hypothetical protein ACRD2B_03295 [Terriglobia bacterium]